MVKDNNEGMEYIMEMELLILIMELKLLVILIKITLVEFILGIMLMNKSHLFYIKTKQKIHYNFNYKTFIIIYGNCC